MSFNFVERVGDSVRVERLRVFDQETLTEPVTAEPDYAQVLIDAAKLPATAVLRLAMLRTELDELADELRNHDLAEHNDLEEASDHLGDALRTLRMLANGDDA